MKARIPKPLEWVGPGRWDTKAIPDASAEDFLGISFEQRARISCDGCFLSLLSHLKKSVSHPSNFFRNEEP